MLGMAHARIVQTIGVQVGNRQNTRQPIGVPVGMDIRTECECEVKEAAPSSCADLIRMRCRIIFRIPARTDRCTAESECECDAESECAKMCVNCIPFVAESECDAESDCDVSVLF